MQVWWSEVRIGERVRDIQRACFDARFIERGPGNVNNDAPSEDFQHVRSQACELTVRLRSMEKANIGLRIDSNHSQLAKPRFSCV